MTANGILSDGDVTTLKPGDRHAVYGMHSYWRNGADDGGKFVIEWSGKARAAFEERALEAFEERSPNGCLVATLSWTSTRVKLKRAGEAKAMYALLTDAMRETDDGRREATYRSKRDELVEKVRENFDRIDGNDLRGGADPEDFEFARERQKKSAADSDITSFEADVF